MRKFIVDRIITQYAWPRTFETQLSMILGMSSPLVHPSSIMEMAPIQICVPVASPIPSHRLRETVFEYRCFLRYNETPLRNFSSPTNFDSMRSTIGAYQMRFSS